MFWIQPILVQKELRICDQWHVMISASFKINSAEASDHLHPYFCTLMSYHMPRLSLDSLFLGWSHLGSNQRRGKRHAQNYVCLYKPTDGEISTLKLATRSAFCLVPGTSGPQNSYTQTWAFKETSTSSIDSNMIYKQFTTFVPTSASPKNRGSLLTMGSMFLYARFAQIHGRSKLHPVLLVM